MCSAKWQATYCGSAHCAKGLHPTVSAALQYASWRHDVTAQAHLGELFNEAAHALVYNTVM